MRSRKNFSRSGDFGLPLASAQSEAVAAVSGDGVWAAAQLLPVTTPWPTNSSVTTIFIGRLLSRNGTVLPSSSGKGIFRFDRKLMYAASQPMRETEARRPAYVASSQCGD